MIWIWGAIKIIIVLGTLITIHELGHFLVAKACNMKVHKFAIGFGPKIFVKQGKETEYTLRLIPFGGFVQLEGEEKRSEDERAFNQKPVWQRILVVAAGATVNIIFSLLVYFIITMAMNSYSTAQLVKVDGTTVSNIGFKTDDLIKSINGKDVLTSTDVENIISENKSDEFIFVIRRGSKDITLKVTIPAVEKGLAGFAFSEDNEVIYLTPGGGAEKAGIIEGDIISSIGGTAFSTSQEILDYIRSKPEETLKIGVLRNGEEVLLDVTTESTIARIFDAKYFVTHPDFFENAYYAFDETGYFFNATIEGILEIFTGKVKSVQIMGPVGISQTIVETNNWYSFFYLMAAISLSLGIFNLLPIPALDGGKILILVIEWVRGKPIKESIEIGLQLAGFAAIILLAVIITISDVINIF